MKSLNTEIISVGTELLLGHVVNTDTKDVSEALSRIGINVLWQSVVGDNPERLSKAIEIAKQRADIIITTGGLGPTCDDITKSLLASSFGLELKRNEEEYKGLYEYILSGKSHLTDNVYVQADLPEGCIVFHNSCGTAPGCAFQKDGKIVAMLPGPPKECRAMINKSLIPYLKSVSGDVIVSHSINIFGIGESGVDDIFRDKMDAMTNPSMAPYAKECDCLVQLTAKAGSEAEAEEMLRPHILEVKERLGEYVYGMDVDNLEQRVLQLLEEHNKTVAFSEHYTGGDVASRFTSLPGSEKYFAGGVINGDTKTLKADIIVDVMVEDERFDIYLSSNGEIFENHGATGKNRPRSFMRQMAGNFAFDTIRRYLCRQ